MLSSDISCIVKSWPQFCTTTYYVWFWFLITVFVIIWHFLYCWKLALYDFVLYMTLVLNIIICHCLFRISFVLWFTLIVIITLNDNIYIILLLLTILTEAKFFGFTVGIIFKGICKPTKVHIFYGVIKVLLSSQLHTKIHLWIDYILVVL